MTAVVSVVTGLATWPASVASFIRWTEGEQGHRDYSIPDVMFNPDVTIGRIDALFWAFAWFAGFAVLFLATALFFKPASRVLRTIGFIQIIAGSCYVVLMMFATSGLW